MNKISYASRQNISYFSLVIFTSICTVILFYWYNQNLIEFYQAEKKYANQDFTQAIIHYKKSLEFGMSINKVGPNLANSYVSLKQFDEALPIYQQFLINNPDDNQIRLEYAKLLSWLGRYEEAEIETQKIKEGKKE